MFFLGPRTFDAAKAAYTRRDFRKARRIWVELARTGDARAQCKLGDMYHHGVGVSQNIATAVSWYRKAAARGNSEARAWLKLRDEQSLRRVTGPGRDPMPGTTLVHPIDPGIDPRAEPAPEPNAEPDILPPFLAARPRAQIHRIDDARRNRRHTLAAGAAATPADDEPLVLTEMVTAQTNTLQTPGLPTPVVPAPGPAASAAAAAVIAVDDRAIDDHAAVDPPAAAHTAPVPTRGERLRNAKNAYAAGDFETAQGEWAALADVGVAEAQLQLAMMYDNGVGVDADQVTAIKWYHQAAAQSKSRAQYNLAVIYALGNGVPVDFVSAYLWFALARDTGHAEAGAGVTELERHLSPAQLAIARGRLKQWQTRSPSDDPS